MLLLYVRTCNSAAALLVKSSAYRQTYLDESCSRLVHGGSLRESRKAKWQGASIPKDGRRGKQLGCTEQT